jgi:peptidoglycan/xylan/chitin deacetylase (PgdA/CDA1 family)
MPALPPDDPRPARREEARRDEALRKLHLKRRIVAGIAAAVTVIVVFAGIWLLYGALFGGGDSDAARSTTPKVHQTTPQEAADLRETAFNERSAAEHKAVADTLARMPYVAKAGAQNKELALTFDDGPGPFTLDLVKVLRKYHVPATFFQTGGTLHYFTDAQAELERGHQFLVANHTVTHPHLGRMTAAEQTTEIDDNNRILTDSGVAQPQLFRPPFGDFDQTTLKLLKQRGMLMVFWSIDSQDWARPGVDVIISNVLTKAEPGSIVLMHDAGGDRSQTIAALPKIITRLRKRGYKFVTVPKLLLDNPAPDIQPPIVPGVG